MDAQSKQAKRSIACRECQRLKLKCSRSWPCESCVKRRVADICPDGVLPSTKRHRTNLLDTSRVYERNQEMSIRIRQLETALAAMQSNLSNETHPLLSDSLLHIGSPMQLPSEIEGIKSNTTQLGVEETIDAFGTLRIEFDGRTVFHNQAVSADYILAPQNSTKLRHRAIAEAMVLPAEIINFGTLFPFGDARISPVAMKRHIVSFLPAAVDARHLAKNYFTYFTWWFDPISRDQFEQEIHPILGASEDEIRADRLSTLFMILAIGTILDVNAVALKITSADSYWQLSRAAFCLEPLMDASTTTSIQALQLIVAYLHITGREKVEQLWVLLGLVSRLIHGFGLHFDPQHWIKNDTNTVQRRRKILHEALAYDALMSFVMGRPPAFRLVYVQCKLPVDDENHITKTGARECGFAIWKYRFTKDCLVPVMEEVFGAKPPSYTTILRLDRNLREYPAPSYLMYPGLGSQREEADMNNVSFRVWMQRAFLFALKEMSIIGLHRAHFAHAVTANLENPLEGKYAPSVLATFRSASRVVSLVRDISSRYMIPVSRVWWLWQNIFSVGITLATFVVRSPKCKLAKSALIELYNANNLLQNRCVPCRSEHYRNLMTEILSAAEDAFRRGTPSEKLNILEDDELVLFTAATRTVASNGSQSMLMPQVEDLAESMVPLRNDTHPDLIRLLEQGLPEEHPVDGCNSGMESMYSQFNVVNAIRDAF